MLLFQPPPNVVDVVLHKVLNTFFWRYTFKTPEADEVSGGIMPDVEFDYYASTSVNLTLDLSFVVDLGLGCNVSLGEVDVWIEHNSIRVGRIQILDTNWGPGNNTARLI